MGNSCQLRPLSAAPTVNFCFPPSRSSNIYMACGVCLLCVCAWKFSTLFAGRRKSKEGGRGGEVGTGRRDSLLHLLWRQTVKGISVMLGLLWAPLPFSAPTCPAPVFPHYFPSHPPQLSSCYLPHSMLPSNLAALYHNVKVTFWKSAQRERKITFTHTQQRLCSTLPLPSLCHTHVNTFSHRLVAFALFLLLLLFSLCILSFFSFSLSFSFCL